MSDATDGGDLALLARLIAETSAEMKLLRDQIRQTIAITRRVERRLADALDEMREASRFP